MIDPIVKRAEKIRNKGNKINIKKQIETVQTEIDKLNLAINIQYVTVPYWKPQPSYKIPDLNAKFYLSSLIQAMSTQLYIIKNEVHRIDQRD